MKLHQEDLQRVQTYYAQYQNAENLEELFNGEMKQLLAPSMKDDRLDKYARGMAIAIATFEKRVKEDPSYAEKLTELCYELASLGSKIDNSQFEKVIKYRDKLDKIESISSLGEVETDDPDVQAAETNPVNLNELEFPEDRKREAPEYEVDKRTLLGATLKAHAVVTDLDKPDESVLFDYVFFNEILEDKDAMLDRIKDKDFLFGDMAERELDIGEVPADVDPREAATFDAAARIKTYMTLEKRSQNRGFLDVLKHPFNTFKEWRIKNNLEKDLKARYGLSKETLGKMTKEVLDTEHPKGGNGYEEMGKDFVAFSKTGEVISAETHTLKDVQRIADADYPKDPDFDAKLEARRKAEEEKARAEEAPEEDDEELDVAKLGDDTSLQKQESEKEKSPFLQNSPIMLTGQEIDNAPKN